MKYFAIINLIERIQLFSWDANSFRNNPELHFATDNLVHIKNLLEEIEVVSIVNEQDIEIAHFTEYNGFSSISYLGRNYSTQLEEFANELVVTLTKVDLVSQVKRLDEQINPIIDIESMTLQEYKDYKINQLSNQGEATIFTGTEVELTNGTIKNFTYDLEDQSNLLNAIFIIQALDDLTITIPYHEHGQPCELYNALDILTVYINLQIFSTTIQTLTNMRINWVRACETKEEVEAINFDTPLPEEWQERANAVLIPAMEIVETLRRKYFPEVEETGESNE